MPASTCLFQNFDYSTFTAVKHYLPHAHYWKNNTDPKRRTSERRILKEMESAEY